MAYPTKPAQVEPDRTTASAGLDRALARDRRPAAAALARDTACGCSRRLWRPSRWPATSSTCAISAGRESDPHPVAGARVRLPPGGDEGHPRPLPPRDALVLAERGPGRHRAVLRDAQRIHARRSSSGSGIALLVTARQSIVKVAFNLANFALIAVVTLGVFHRIATLERTAGRRRLGRLPSRRCSSRS